MALLVATELEFAELVEKCVRTWNEFLRTQTIEIGSSSKEATMLLSAHQIFTDVLEDPLEYDFSEDDVTNEGPGIRMDDLYLRFMMYWENIYCTEGNPQNVNFLVSCTTRISLGANT